MLLQDVTKSILLSIGFFWLGFGVFHRTTPPRSSGSLRLAHLLTEECFLITMFFMELMIFFLCEANLSMFVPFRSRKLISGIISNGTQWRSCPRKAISVQIVAVKRVSHSVKCFSSRPHGALKSMSTKTRYID